MKKYVLLFFSFLAIVAIGGARIVSTTNTFGNFDNDNNGDLNGQDGWSNVWNPLFVQDAVTFQGTKAIKNDAQFGAAGYKELPKEFLDAGVVSAEVRIDGNSFSDNQDLFGVYKGIGEEYIALFRFANNFDNRQNMLLLSIADSADVIELGQMTQGEWHKISLGWRKSDFKIRVKVDNNSWTEWFDSQTSWEGGPFGIRISSPAANDYGNFYFADVNSSSAEAPVQESSSMGGLGELLGF